MRPRLWNSLKCALAGLVVALAATPIRADDAKKMQGTWDVASVEVGNKKPSTLKGWSVTIDGDKFTLNEGGGKSVTVHFTINSEVKPATIEFFKDAGKKDKLWHGIYDFTAKDKELKLCWGPAGEDRPKKFDTNKKNDNRLYTLKKD